MNSNNNESFNNMTHYELLQAIHNGSVDAKIIPKDVRQALVQILVLRGQEKIAIAAILKVTDRTIRRDVDDIWEQNELHYDPEFTKKFAGEILTRTMSFVEILTRIANSTDGKLNERIAAAFRGFQSMKGLVDAFQSLGYLPLNHRRAIAEEPKKPDQPKGPVGKKASGSNKKSSVMQTVDSRKEAILKTIDSMPPMERERLRTSLVKEIIKLSQEEAVLEEQPPGTKEAT